MAPSVYIIVGPNGAGKTTFAREFLPRYANCKHFVNADLIAAGVSPFSPEAAAFRAGRLMLEEIDRLANRGDDFGFETTLAGMTCMNLIRRLRRQDYSVHILFLWVAGVELALSRIKDRVLEGGHDVPESFVRRRFDRSIKNLLYGYRQLADTWNLFDNSVETPVVIACKELGEVRIMRPDFYRDLLERYRKR